MFCGYTIHRTEKVSGEVNRKCLLWTQQYNFEPPTPTLSATMHSVTDRQTDNSITTIVVEWAIRSIRSAKNELNKNNSYNSNWCDKEQVLSMCEMSLAQWYSLFSYHYYDHNTIESRLSKNAHCGSILHRTICLFTGIWLQITGSAIFYSLRSNSTWNDRSTVN